MVTMTGQDRKGVPKPDPTASEYIILRIEGEALVHGHRKEAWGPAVAASISRLACKQHSPRLGFRIQVRF